jgi:hypothetical protein
MNVKNLERNAKDAQDQDAHYAAKDNGEFMVPSAVISVYRPIIQSKIAVTPILDSDESIDQ